MFPVKLTHLKESEDGVCVHGTKTDRSCGKLAKSAIGSIAWKRNCPKGRVGVLKVDFDCFRKYPSDKKL